MQVFILFSGENSSLYMDMFRTVRAQLNAHTRPTVIDVDWVMDWWIEDNRECWGSFADVRAERKGTANVFFSQRLEMSARTSSLKCFIY